MRGRKRKVLDDSTLLASYQAGQSEAQIASDLGVGRSTVHRRLVTAGIVLRSAVEATSLRTRRDVTIPQHLQETMEGLLLGDAWVEQYRTSEARICLAQSIDHSTWLDQIEAELTAASIQTTRSIRGPRKACINGREFVGKPEVLLRSRKYQPFSRLRERWYPTGAKRVPRDVLLTPRSIAQWYWGDGSTTNSGYVMVFHTEGFDLEDVQFLSQRLCALYGWYLTIQERKLGQFTLNLHRKQHRLELVELISPFCPPCFKYKLEAKR